jgi:hypothetical protein
MKISFFVLFIFAIHLSLHAERELARSYSVDSTVYRSSISEGSSKAYFSFKNVPLTKGMSAQTVIYAVDNQSNQTASIGKNNEFEIDLTPGKHQFKIYYNPYFLEFELHEIEFKSTHKTFISCYLSESNYLKVTCDKPVIYLYPTQPTLVHIAVQPKGEFTFTYPLYDNGWKVNADQDGNLDVNGNQYNYLFWESKQNWNPKTSVFESGFVVSKVDVTNFLEEKLTAFGFNSKEKADFITYWGPQLIRNERNYIHFLFNEDCNEFAELTISPNPDNIYRFYMISMPLNDTDDYIVPAQEIKTMDRNGFTVLEWGGSQISKKMLHSDKEL